MQKNVIETSSLYLEVSNFVVNEQDIIIVGTISNDTPTIVLAENIQKLRIYFGSNRKGYSQPMDTTKRHNKSEIL